MRKKENFFLAFFVVLIFSLFIFGLSKTGILNPITSVTQKIFSPFQAVTYVVFDKITSIGDNGKLKGLQEDNIALSKQLLNQTKLIEDNNALKDQFLSESVRKYNLIPADIFGAPGFIPGISVPETLVLDRGSIDGIRSGDAVIYEDNLLGKIDKVYSYTSDVILITSSSFSFTARTLKTNALGVVKGQGGGDMILDNVLLSESLSKNDLVLTNGSMNSDGTGFPPGLIVGKIISISKNPSDLFQKADIKSIVQVSSLNKVFVISGLR